MTDKILGIVVTYNPQLDSLKELIEATKEQVSQLMVVDNASANQSSITELSHQHQIHLIELKDNLGLGAAHNVGIDYAEANGFDYMLILDQDSVPKPTMVQSLLTAHKTKSLDQDISAVGVTYENADNGSLSSFTSFGWLKFQHKNCSNKDSHGCIEVDFLISSGSLISLKSVGVIGKMDETLFVDHIDTEWFLRARDKGYKAYGVCDAVMLHGLGESTHKVNLSIGKMGRQRNVPQHKPFRYYYIFRNSILLYKRRYSSWLWRWNDLQRLFMIMIMFGLIKAPRRENLSMMIRGLFDGLIGKTGKLDYSAD